MASMGRRSEEKAESSYDRDPSSQHQFYQRQRRRQPAHHNNPPYSSSNNPYQHDPLPPGQPLYQQHTMQPPPYPPNGNATDKITHGNYNSVNNSNNNPVPPRMRMRKWSDMTRTIWHYERIEQIGEGTYGQVYRARCKDTNEIVAMKKIRVHYGAHWGMPPTVIREIKILKRLVHPNLVRMHEVVSSKGVEHLDANDYHKGSDRSRKNKHKSGVGGHGGADNNGKDNNNSTKNDNNSTSNKIDISDAREGYKGNLFLVLEYVPHDLTGLLDVAYKFSEVEIKCVFRQLLEALRYMHDQKYVHRDIKSSNILIDRNFRLKLADFGLARSIEPPLLDNLHDRANSQEFTNKVITLWYRPPELLLGATRYGFAVDIWSAGCILAELVLGRPLFTGKTDMEQLQLIFDMVGTPTTKSWPGIGDLKLLRTGDVSIDGDKNRKRPKLRERYQTKMNNIAPGAINLVEKLLELDPSKRLTASRALNHRYFLQEPRAPDQPDALGEMKLAEGGSFHEFQTKKKRKEAKAEAEKIKQAALDGGHTTKQAQEEYDACYRGIMEKVAREGLESLSAANNSAKTAANETTEGEHNQELSEIKMEDRHSGKHRSSRSDRSLDHRSGSSKSSRDKDHRDSSSRGRDRRARERGDGSSSKQDIDREAESGSSHRDRGHDRERSRSRSRRASESDDRRKKRRRESSGEDAERSSRRDRDKERHREHRKSSKDESGGKADGIDNKTENTTIDPATEEKPSSEIVATDRTRKNEPSKPNDTVDTENGVKNEKITIQPSQSKQEKDKNEPPRDGTTDIDKPNKTESKPNQEKQPTGEQHPRSTSSRDERKRGDRSRDRIRDDDARKDRRDRDRDHHRRSSKDRDGRSRDSSIKKRKSRTRSRSRSPERDRSRDDRHHRHRRDRDRDRDHSRRERDRDRRPDDLRDMDRRFRNDGHPHPDDWGPGAGGRGPPLGMQRRGGDFPSGNPEFGGPRPDHHPRGGDFGPYGGGGDRGPPPRGGGGPGGFHGPPGRHQGPGGGNNRGPPHPHGGGRPPPPMDYYPPGGDHPPPGFRDRDRDRDRGARRDRDRR